MLNIKIIDIYDNGLLTEEQIQESGIEYPLNVNKVIYEVDGKINEVYLNLTYPFEEYSVNELLYLILEQLPENERKQIQL